MDSLYWIALLCFIVSAGCGYMSHLEGRRWEETTEAFTVACWACLVLSSVGFGVVATFA